MQGNTVVYNVKHMEMKIILLSLVVWFSVVFSFVLFDLAVYLKALFKKRAKFSDFMRSKSQNEPIYNLFLLSLVTLMCAAMVFSFVVMFLNVQVKQLSDWFFIVILILLPLVSLGFATTTNLDFIEKFTPSRAFAAGKGKGYVIVWNNQNIGTRFYIALKWMARWSIVVALVFFFLLNIWY
jgi:hypothetical protein